MIKEDIECTSEVINSVQNKTVTYLEEIESKLNFHQDI